jgi:hypothetical protein
MAGVALRSQNRSGNVKGENSCRKNEKFEDYGTNWWGHLNRMQDLITKRYINIFYKAEKHKKNLECDGAIIKSSTGDGTPRTCTSDFMMVMMMMRVVVISFFPIVTP